MEHYLCMLSLILVLILEGKASHFRLKFDVVSVNIKSNEKGPLDLYVTLKKYNRTHKAVDGNCTVREVVDHRYKFKLELQVWGDGGWKRNLVRYERHDPCQQLSLTLGSLWKGIVKTVGHPDKCPFQIGYYHIDDYNLDLSGVPLVMGSGRFKLVVDLYKASLWILSGEAEGEATQFKRKFEIVSFNIEYNKDGPVDLFASLKKYNRTHKAVDGNCTLREVMDSRYRFKLEAQVWGDGGWKRNLVRFERNDPCQQLSLTLGSLWKDIVKAAGHPDKCPFQIGFYHIENYNVDLSGVPLIMGTGRFKVIIDVFKGSLWITQCITEVVIMDYY